MMNDSDDDDDDNNMMRYERYDDQIDNEYERRIMGRPDHPDEIKQIQFNSEQQEILEVFD